MLKILLFLGFFLTAYSPYSFGQALPLGSAVRAPNETFQVARKRHLDRLSREQRQPFDLGISPLNFSIEGVPIQEVPNRVVTTWDPAQVQTRFEWIRDATFLTDPSHPSPRLRRISWLYPHDGCFARAALTVESFRRAAWALPYKIFIFGDLKVSTQNARGGSVYWWYHVVPAIRSGGELLVFDPAIEPAYPLRFLDWVRKMTQNVASVQFAVCSPFSYTPSSKCNTQDHASTAASAYAEQPYFLDAEWDERVALGRNPERDLGDYPPWMR